MIFPRLHKLYQYSPFMPLLEYATNFSRILRSNYSITPFIKGILNTSFFSPFIKHDCFPLTNTAESGDSKPSV